jgi:hypothetical protein
MVTTSGGPHFVKAPRGPRRYTTQVISHVHATKPEHVRYVPGSGRSRRRHRQEQDENLSSFGIWLFAIITKFAAHFSRRRAA